MMINHRVIIHFRWSWRLILVSILMSITGGCGGVSAHQHHRVPQQQQYHHLPGSSSSSTGSLMAMTGYKTGSMMSAAAAAAAAAAYHHRRPPRVRHQQDPECEVPTEPVIDLILERMRKHLPEEKITVQNGAITIFDARIVRFVELSRLSPSCARKLDPEGIQLIIPFEAEIRLAHVSAKLKYNFYVTDLYGDYAANFSHIRMNGTFETNLEEEWMQVTTFNITDSRVVDDSIVFTYIPRFILDWIRSYFDNDNTLMYQQLAKVILQKEADNYDHYDLLRHLTASASASASILGREDHDPDDDDTDEDPPLNLL